MARTVVKSLFVQQPLPIFSKINLYIFYKINFFITSATPFSSLEGAI